MQDSHTGEETRQARAREKTEKGKRLSVASFSTSTLSLSSCQCRAPIVRFNRYSGTSPLGHFYWRDTKNVHIIFVFVTSFEGTPLFRGKGHFFKVATPRFNLHSGDTLALNKWLTTGHNSATVFKIRTISKKTMYSAVVQHTKSQR